MSFRDFCAKLIPKKDNTKNLKSEATLLFENGQRLFLSYEFFKAIDCLNKAIDLRNDYADAYFIKGRCLDKLGREKEALECYNEAIKYQHIEAYNYKAYLIINTNITESIQLAEKVLELYMNPKSSDDFYNRSFALDNLKKYSEAIINIDKAIEINPNESKYGVLKGCILYAMDKIDESTEAWHEVIKLDKNCAMAYNNIGANLKDSKKFEEAIDYFNKAISLDKYSVLYYYNKGLSLAELKIYSEALKCFDKMLEINPFSVKAYYEKGLIFSQQGGTGEALQCLNKAINLNDKHEDSYALKGAILHDLLQYSDAIECYNKIIEINSTSDLIYYSKACALSSLNRHREAIQSFDKAIELNSTEKEYYFNKGKALEELKQYKEALKCLTKAIDLDPQYYEAINQRKNILKKINEGMIR